MNLFNYFWVMALLFTSMNALAIKRKADECIDTQPELGKGYRSVFKAMLIFGNIPWAIMGVGVITGITKNIFEFLNPSGLNPMVLLFHAYVVALYVLIVRWIYFKGGAEFLVQHPGMVKWHGFSSSGDPSPTAVKGFVALAILGGIGGMLFMWFGPTHMHR